MATFNGADCDKAQSLADSETHLIHICSGCCKGWHHSCMMLSLSEVKDIELLSDIFWHNPCNDTCICGGKVGSHHCTCGITSCKIIPVQVFENTIPESWICLYCHSKSIIVPGKTVEVGPKHPSDITLEEAVKVGGSNNPSDINCNVNLVSKIGLEKEESSVKPPFSPEKRDFAISPRTFGLDTLAQIAVSVSECSCHGESQTISRSDTTLTDSGTSIQQQGLVTTANSRSSISLPGEMPSSREVEPECPTPMKVSRDREELSLTLFQQDGIKCSNGSTSKIENFNKEVKCLPGHEILMVNEEEDCFSSEDHIHHISDSEVDDSDHVPSDSETLALRKQRKRARDNRELTTWRKQGDRSRKKYKYLHEIRDDLHLMSKRSGREDFDKTHNNEKVSEENFAIKVWEDHMNSKTMTVTDEGPRSGDQAHTQISETEHHDAASGRQLNERTEELQTKDIVPYTANIQERKDITALTSPSQLQRWPFSMLALQTSKVARRLMINDRKKRRKTRAAVDLDENVDSSDHTLHMTVPNFHFGPITADHDPQERRGVLVGDTWKGRKGCKQWCVHSPSVSGIAGQKKYGAQSVCLSGGYEDDEDHGEWFIYSGSGGRDNKKEDKKSNHANFQTTDQTFTGRNASIRTSCINGLPVRVLRSNKFKRSPFAPKRRRKCFRYDGIYRVEMCWKIDGKKHGLKVCRFLFIRCDNQAAPWPWEDLRQENEELSSASPPLRFQRVRIEAMKILAEEMRRSSEITERTTPPCWDWKRTEKEWGWVKDPPSTNMCNREGKNLENRVFQRECGPGRLSLPTSESEFIRMKRELNSNHADDQAISCSSCQTVLVLQGNEDPHAHFGYHFCTSCLHLNRTRRNSLSNSLKEMAARRSLECREEMAARRSTECGNEFAERESIEGGKVKIRSRTAHCTGDLTNVVAHWNSEETIEKHKINGLQMPSSVRRPGVNQAPSRPAEEEEEDDDNDKDYIPPEEED